MATVEEALLTDENRIVLSGISWAAYEQLRDSEENRHVHMAYDGGSGAARRNQWDSWRTATAIAMPAKSSRRNRVRVMHLATSLSEAATESGQ